MTLINLSKAGRGNCVRLAHQPGRKLTVTYLGAYDEKKGGLFTAVHHYVTDSITKEHMHFHDVELWTDGAEWFGECDGGLSDDDKWACQANHKGGKLCSHLAAAALWLEAKGILNFSDAERDYKDVFG